MREIRNWTRTAVGGGARVACLVAGTMLGCSGTSDENGRGIDLSEQPAFLVVQRILTPDGRNVLLTAVPDLQAQMIDPTNAVILAGQSRALVYGGKVYGFAGEEAAVIRYGVDESFRFVEEDRFSMANLGISSFRSTILFISPNRAYYLDILEQRVIVFDPSAMAISGTFDVPEFVRPGLFTTTSPVMRIGDEVLVPLSFANGNNGQLEPSVVVVVLSAEEDRVLRVLSDDRCALSAGVVDLGDGQTYYAVGDSADGSFDIFGVQPLPPPCVLRTQVGSDRFDPSFVVDLRALTGRPHISAAIGRGDGTFLTRVYDADIDPATLTDPVGFFDLELWRFALVNPAQATVSVFDQLPLSGLSFPHSVVDGAYYGPVVDEDSGRTTLFRLNDDGSVTESISLTGDIQRVARIR